MVALRVNLDGISTELRRLKIDLKQLILDIENPRIQYFLDTRLNDNINQEKIKFALAEGNDQYEKLKEHIERNKGIYDPIWVVPKDDFYTVIEGNTRAFIYEELSEKYVNDEKWKSIDAYVLPYKVDRNVINFIRLEKHLFGTTPWDAYEKARELYRLNTEEDYSLKRLEQLTKLSASDIRNNIQAFMDMEKQYLPKYNKPAERLKFSYFVEFRKIRELKRLFKDGKVTLEEFCDWVGEGKFRRGEDIRKLPMVLKDEQSRQALIDDNFQAALDQLEQKNPAAKSKLFEKIEDVVDGLEGLPFGELDEIKRGLQPAKVDSLKKLYNVTTNLLRDIGTIE
ncbi:MAG: hypothetical protein M1508_00650 [Nitrospirae bacterium]|nr:hypothetical protein [Nitrospirota bacterium]MCL5422940.1 hypothetical protein [Nitrospirota bacterium]